MCIRDRQGTIISLTKRSWRKLSLTDASLNLESRATWLLPVSTRWQCRSFATTLATLWCRDQRNASAEVHFRQCAAFREERESTSIFPKGGEFILRTS